MKFPFSIFPTILILTFVLISSCSKSNMSDEEFEQRVRKVLAKMEKEGTPANLPAARTSQPLPVPTPKPQKFKIVGDLAMKEEVKKMLANDPDYKSKKKVLFEVGETLYYGPPPTKKELEELK